MAGVTADPNWVLAILGAGGAFLGAWRVATRYFARRRERQDDYERLHCDFYGWPAEMDDYGNEVSPARAGVMARIEALEHPQPRKA